MGGGEGEGLTPQHRLYAELAKQEHVISAGGTPRFLENKLLLGSNPMMAIVSVHAYSPARQRHFWVEVPISKELFEDMPTAVLFEFVMKEVRRFSEGSEEIVSGE